MTNMGVCYLFGNPRKETHMYVNSFASINKRNRRCEFYLSTGQQPFAHRML